MTTGARFKEQGARKIRVASAFNLPLAPCSLNLAPVLKMARFEDLEVWKRSARLSANLYKAMIDLKDFGFRDQITRAGLSIPSNIAEG